MMSEEELEYPQSGLDDKTALRIRTVWYGGKLYFSLVDIVAYLKVSKKPARSYWAQLKEQVQSEGFREALTRIVKLPLKAADQRIRETDCADRETVLRIIQSIPSPKAEPIKAWLARVGDQKLDELQATTPADADFLEKQQAYLDRGYDQQWARLRVQCDLIRNALTDTWQDRGIVLPVEFSVLTNTMHVEAFGLAIKAHKKFKQLSAKENLRDHMTPAELGLEAFVEGLANTLHHTRNSRGYDLILLDVVDAGGGGKVAREVAEQIIGEPVVSDKNYKQLLKARRKGRQRSLPEQSSLFDRTEPGEQQNC